MTEKRNRWLISIALIIAVVAFLGISILPPVFDWWGRRSAAQTANQGPTPEATSAAQQSELQTQAKGYELVLQREPDNQTALRGLVDTRIKLGDIQGVIEPLKKLAELNPGQPEYSVLLAQAQQQTGDLEGAAQTYRTVLTEQPGNMNALQGLVTLLMTQDRPQAAIGLLQDTLRTADQANQVQPGSVDVTSVNLLLAQVYANQERYDDAIAIYDAAIEKNAQDFRPVLAKAIVLKAQGKTDEAQPLFTSAAALAPAQYKDQINQMAQSDSTTAESSLPAPDVSGGDTTEESQPIEEPAEPEADSEAQSE